METGEMHILRACVRMTGYKQNEDSKGELE
jgi:hypothetical protein